MPASNAGEHEDKPRLGPLKFTPAEWRVVLEDKSFLRDPDNDFAPRRLLGFPVVIVQNHDEE